MPWDLDAGEAECIEPPLLVVGADSRELLVLL